MDGYKSRLTAVENTTIITKEETEAKILDIDQEINEIKRKYATLTTEKLEMDVLKNEKKLTELLKEIRRNAVRHEDDLRDESQSLIARIKRVEQVVEDKSSDPIELEDQRTKLMKVEQQINLQQSELEMVTSELRLANSKIK